MRVNANHIVATAIILSFGTLLALQQGLWMDVATFPGALFASWVAGVALFDTVGVIVALASLRRPQDESFDARARILFQHQEGQHIDHIISKLKEDLENYSDSTKNKIIIQDFHGEENKYRIGIDAHLSIRSYIPDIVSTYQSSIKLSGVTAPPGGGARNRIVSFRIDGEPVSSCLGEFDDSVDRAFHTRILPGCSCNVEHSSEYWFRAEIGAQYENHTYRPKRFAQLVTLSIENRLTHGVVVKLSKDQGANWENIQIQRGQVREIVSNIDAPPLVEVYRFRLLAPSP